jgi:hypothetical protein
MQLTTKNNYTLITTDQNSVEDFYNSFMEKENDLLNMHLIVIFSENFNITSKEILLFLGIANKFRQLSMSFVIVCSEIDIDDVPDEIVVAPTLSEAEDVLEMEAMERDLMNL